MFTLTITDFMSHANTVIKVDKMTAIEGKNDSGKSALVNALYWLVSSDIKGDNVIRKGKTNACVEMKFDDVALKKTRYKTKTVWDVVVGDDIFTYESAAVPDKVKDILNMYFADTGLQFSNQHDSLYMLAYGGQQNVGLLNKFMRLDILDTATRNVSKTISMLSTEIKVLERRLEEDEDILHSTESILERYNTTKVAVEDLLDKITKSEALIDELKTLQENYSKLSLVLSETKQQYDTIKAFIDSTLIKDYIESTDSYVKLKDTYMKFLTVKAAYDNTYTILTEFDSVQIDTESIRNVIEGAEVLSVLNDLTAKETKLLAALDLLRNKKISSTNPDDLINLYDKYKDTASTIDFLIAETSNLQELKAEYEQQLHTVLEETGGACPLCGKLMEDEQ